MPYLYRLTLDSVGQVAFGMDCESIENPEKEYKVIWLQLQMEFRIHNKILGQIWKT